MTKALQTLLDAVERHRPEVDREHLQDGLARYVELLLDHGRRTNLIGITDPERLYSDLLFDSLLPALVAPPSGILLDAGSGAGLPGIPLTMMGLNTTTWLVEPRRKRHVFLSLVVEKLNLEESVKVGGKRIETFKGVKRGDVDVMAAKAFQPPPKWLATAHEWLKPGGLVYLYVSEESWSAEAKEVAKKLRFETVGSLEHPLRSTRKGLVLKKGE